jgi:hypothetical protein
MTWKCTPGQGHAKRMINKSSNKLTSGLLILPRSQIDDVGSGAVNRTLPPEMARTQTRDI